MGAGARSTARLADRFDFHTVEIEEVPAPTPTCRPWAEWKRILFSTFDD
jgi:hypothetical protein